jgi:hypothetical protein
MLLAEAQNKKKRKFSTVSALVYVLHKGTLRAISEFQNFCLLAEAQGGSSSGAARRLAAILQRQCPSTFAK